MVLAMASQARTVRVARGHRPKSHEHGVLVRAEKWASWHYAAAPRDAAERFDAIVRELADLPSGDTTVVVEQIEFGQVVREQTQGVAR
jgi:hypothetical protein